MRRVSTACGLVWSVFLTALLAVGIAPAEASGQSASTGQSAAIDGRSALAGRYLAAVRQFADNVLEHGRDTYRNTPLFVDGVNVDTHEPATWLLPEDCAAAWNMPRRWIMSNLASQQNLFRVLDGLTLATQDPKYRQAAADATGYAFEHLRYKDGLLFWGGHCLVDLATGQVVGESHKDWSRNVPIPATWDTGLVHELKHHFPYYELMWDVNPQATRQFIEAFWGSHIQNWSNLDMNRHGVYGQGAGPGWDHEYVGGPVPFVGKGLSILHGGTDLIYSAGMLTLLNGDERPLTWARRMVQRYAEIRHPVTGLGPDLYNYYRNERVLAQFGPEWGERITEATIVSIWGSRYGDGALSLLKLAERLGPRGQAFRQLATEDLIAYARHGYDPEANAFWSMLTDGTKLSPDMAKRPGPITPGLLEKRGAGITHLWVYALAAHASKDPLLAQTARSIGRALGFGDIGDLADSRGQEPRLNLETKCASPEAIFVMLDLHEKTGRREFLDLAVRIGDRVLAGQFHRGFFVPGADHLFVKFDTIAPLALLHLDARLNQWPVAMPFYLGGSSFFHCDHEGMGRTYDGEAVFSRRREARRTAGATGE